MKNAAATAYIRELCALGLAGELLIPAVLEALHRVVPSARNLFDWVGGDGHIERYYFEGPIDHGLARLYFDEFHNRREAEAMPRYRDVICGAVTVRGAEELNHRSFFESALYQEIWRPQRLHYRLEGIVRGRAGQPLGSLVLYRERGEPIFGRADEEMLATLLPYIARGLERGPPQGRRHEVDFDAGADRATALVNLDATGRLVHLSRDAHKVLLLAHGDITPATVGEAPRCEDFPTLGLVHRHFARPGAQAQPPFALALANAWGRFDFRAERLEAAQASAATMIGVTIHHRAPREVRDLDALAAQPLSIAQKKVCALLLSGLAHARIARELGVSPSTVADHVRKIYRRLDVHSLDQLRGRLARR